MRPLFEQWFCYMMQRLDKLDEAKMRLASHWRLKLDDQAKKTLHSYLQHLCYKAFLYIAERYCCWFLVESSNQWNVKNPSAAVVWMLRCTFWYDEYFGSTFVADV